MNELARRLLPHMTADEFLAWPGDDSGRKFHLIDGEVWPMSPASRIHAAIQANLAYLLVDAIRKLPDALAVYTEGAIIPALNAGDNVRVPDVVVGPADDSHGDQVVPEPIVIIEILSPGNKAATRDNVRAYATLASVSEIVVVHSSRVEVEVNRRTPDGRWPAAAEIVGPGGRLRLHALKLDRAVEDVYAHTVLARSRRL